MLNKPLDAILNIRHQKILMRSAAYNFSHEHVTGTNNRICDALSRLCTTVNQTCHITLPTPRLLPMSKKVTTHSKQIEILDPLVIELAAAGAVDESYLCMLNELENGVRGKELGEHLELQTNQGMMNELGVTLLPDGNRLIVMNGV